MTDQQQRRRLVRMAAAMNKRARAARVPGTVTWTDLASLDDWCAYCGIGLEPMHGSYDHIAALDRGGANALPNIVRCCITCQRRKFTKSHAEFVEAELLEVTCALPGCGKRWKPRYAEYKRGVAKYCSLSHAAKSRWIHA